MPQHSVLHVIFLIFTGTAILSTIALYTRQSLLVAYILLGMIIGPFALKLVNNSVIVEQIGYIGIIFLLFLMGLNLQPQNLLNSLKKMSLITFASSIIFLLIGFIIAIGFGFNFTEGVIIGLTMMFSSTIIGLKLIPTTVLHHQHTGELMASILLLQDVIAIAVLLIIQGLGVNKVPLWHLSITLISFPVLFLLSYYFERFILAKLFSAFDKIHEYIFILSIGWCLFMAELSHLLGLSSGIGAFIAGVVLASNPLSFYISDHLKALRDFFLVIFFFTIGAGFNFAYFPMVAVPAILISALILALKPMTFSYLLQKAGEAKNISKEMGVRLGQGSEFSLLVITAAAHVHLVSLKASVLVQAATLITFIISCYWVVLRYPTPLATSDKLRRD